MAEALPGGAAGSLFGRLGFALNAVQGRYGRALMKPIKRRQYEHRSNLNNQLRASLEWWVKFLRTYTPRSIPVNLSSLKVVISYSDGEGTGGVGVALWYSDTRRPKAAFMVVPWLLRRLWALQTSKVFRGAEQRDIFEIEAIGPLLILAGALEELPVGPLHRQLSSPGGADPRILKRRKWRRHSVGDMEANSGNSMLTMVRPGRIGLEPGRRT